MLAICNHSLIDILQSGRKRCEWPSNEKFADAVFDCPQVTTLFTIDVIDLPRTTSRMGTSSPATCVLRRAATADLEEPSCARRTPPGTKAQCGVHSSECLEQWISLVLNVPSIFCLQHPSFEFYVVLHCHQLPHNKSINTHTITITVKMREKTSKFLSWKKGCSLPHSTSVVGIAVL